MDHDPGNNLFTRLRGDGFKASYQDGLIEIQQDADHELMRVILNLDEAIDLSAALKELIEKAKQEETA